MPRAHRCSPTGWKESKTSESRLVGHWHHWTWMDTYCGKSRPLETPQRQSRLSTPCLYHFVPSSRMFKLLLDLWMQRCLSEIQLFAIHDLLIHFPMDLPRASRIKRTNIDTSHQASHSHPSQSQISHAMPAPVPRRNTCGVFLKCDSSAWEKNRVAAEKRRTVSNFERFQVLVHRGTSRYGVQNV